MTIHATDPFATPEPERSPVRRLRGRLPAAVTLWTSDAQAVSAASHAGRPGQRARPAGLTVSSTLIVEGEPGRVLGLIDPESDLWSAVEAAVRFAVVPLRAADARLADTFAGLMPAPGGLFVGYRWQQTPFGPIPEGADSWVGCRLRNATPCGWSLLVEGEIEQVEVGDGGEPLVHYRGRYRPIG